MGIVKKIVNLWLTFDIECKKPREILISHVTKTTFRELYQMPFSQSILFIFYLHTIKIHPVKFHNLRRSGTQPLHHLPDTTSSALLQSSQWATFNCHIVCPICASDTRILYSFTSLKTKSSLLRCWILNKISVSRCNHISHLFLYIFHTSVSSLFLRTK
jgi:hypothetical protein